MRTPGYKPEFYKSIWKLLIPIVVQNLLSAAISSADVVMLNYVSQSAISAVSLASNYAGVLFNLFYGLGTGATLLCAQYYGRGDLRAIATVEAIALRCSMALSAVAAACALLIPEGMMRLFTDDAELISIGAGYLRIMSVAYLCWGIIEIYMSVLRSVGRTGVCMRLNLIAFGLNIVLNATFIFGLFGAPKLGATGVAIATAISRVVELIGCLIVSGREEVKLNIGILFLHSRVLTKDFISRALPAVLNDVIWGVAFSMYSVILGHLGNDAVAANSLVVVVRNISTVFCYAVASAGGVLLGNVMGAREWDKTKAFASHMLRLTLIAGLAGSAVMLAMTPLILRFANLSDTAMYYLKYMLLINSYYIIGAAVNTSLIAGIFRAGGDTRFGLVCDIFDMWCYAVPLGFISAFVLKLPVLWVYFLLCTDEFVKWPWVFKHYFRGNWMQNITRDDIFDTKEEKSHG